MKHNLGRPATTTTLTTATMSSKGNSDKFLNVSPVRQVSSAPHSRSCSIKKAGRRLQQGPAGLDLMDLRPRTNSLPCRPVGGERRQRHASDSAAAAAAAAAGGGTADPEYYKDRGGDTLDRLCRVRSFKLTSKGLVKHGDSFKRRSTHSLMSTGSTATDLSSSSSSGGAALLHRPRTLSLASEESSGVLSGSSSSGGGGSCCAPSYFRVALMGAAGVGKSALIRQFMTSEYRGTFDIVTPDLEDPETTVSVMLDGEESMIEFIDQPQETDIDSLRADAFVVVFSLADQESFTCAIRLVRHLRVDLGSDRAILLVANKADLARQRRIHLSDARVVAMKYDCRLEETSAALNHQVDELLVSILTQIRLSLAPPPTDCLSLPLPPDPPTSKPRSPTALRAMSFLSKLFTQNKKKAKSCDNLLIQ